MLRAGAFAVVFAGTLALAPDAAASAPIMAVDHFPTLPKPAQNGMNVFAQLSL